MQILTAKDIQKNYGLARDAVYSILRRPRCPIISGKGGKQYRIEKQAFEEFIKSGGK